MGAVMEWASSERARKFPHLPSVHVPIASNGIEILGVKITHPGR